MDINYDELFGTEETGEMKETTEAQGQETGETRETGKPETEETEESETRKAEQSKEERARHAMNRRIREAEERGARAQRERDNAIMAELGITDDSDQANPLQLDSLDKAEEYNARKRRQRFEAGNPTEEDIRGIFREERAKSAPTKTAPDPRVQAELDLIAEIDPDMTGLDAILNSDIGDAFRKNVAAGKSFIQAFTAARKEQRAKTGAAASAAAKAASKDHLTGTKTGAEGEVPVPREEMEQFRVFFPEAAEADIQKYYNADRKKFGPK